MSIVKVDTNVSVSDIDELFLAKSTESLAKTFQKDKSDILVFINSDQPILFGGSNEPAAIVTIHCVERINSVDNKLHSAALFPLLTKYLKINEDRITIVFTAVEPHNMGINGKICIQ